MNIDYSELEKGFAEELEKQRMEKHAVLPLVPVISGLAAAAFGPPAIAQVGKTFFPEKHKRWSQSPGNPYSIAEGMRKGLSAIGTGTAAAFKTPGYFNQFSDKLPGIIDNIGKFAPLAMGAMMLPSLMGKGQGQQGGAGQPIVVNNYMGQKPNALTPQQGVHSLSDPIPKMSEFQEKKAGVISEALATAAKRRMANRVLDVVAPEEENLKQQKQTPEELEVITKYPEMAKLLEDEQNKAYLNRLLQH